MIDWIAVLRAVEKCTYSIDQDGTSSVGYVVTVVSATVADELERQRDAAQGNGEEGRGYDNGGSSCPSEALASPAAAADQRAPSPASSERNEVATLLWDHVSAKPGRHGWLHAADAVLAMEAGWRAEIDALRAQLAEREAAFGRDRERLDWLDKHTLRRRPAYGYHGGSYWFAVPDGTTHSGGVPHAGLRAAIDAAMKEKP